MGNCNWCNKPIQVKYQSEHKGDIYYSFCSKKCKAEYNQALEAGNITPPRKSISTWKIILFVCIALFVLSKCN